MLECPITFQGGIYVVNGSNRSGKRSRLPWEIITDKEHRVVFVTMAPTKQRALHNFRSHLKEFGVSIPEMPAHMKGIDARLAEAAL